MLTLANINISATSGSITVKFYQNHHWDGGNAALGVWPERIRTLVSMATDSSHRVIMEKMVLPFFFADSHPTRLILVGNNGMHWSSEEFEIRRDSTIDCGLSCPLASKKIPIDL